jgi:hypothetical protein
MTLALHNRSSRQTRTLTLDVAADNLQAAEWLLLLGLTHPGDELSLSMVRRLGEVPPPSGQA